MVTSVANGAIVADGRAAVDGGSGIRKNWP
jgi:hypothetical protein